LSERTSKVPPTPVDAPDDAFTVTPVAFVSWTKTDPVDALALKSDAFVVIRARDVPIDPDCDDMINVVVSIEPEGSTMLPPPSPFADKITCGATTEPDSEMPPAPVVVMERFGLELMIPLLPSVTSSALRVPDDPPKKLSVPLMIAVPVAVIGKLVVTFSVTVPKAPPSDVPGRWMTEKMLVPPGAFTVARVNFPPTACPVGPQQLSTRSCVNCVAT